MLLGLTRFASFAGPNRLCWRSFQFSLEGSARERSWEAPNLHGETTPWSVQSAREHSRFWAPRNMPLCATQWRSKVTNELHSWVHLRTHAWHSWVHLSTH